MHIGVACLCLYEDSYPRLLHAATCVCSRVVCVCVCVCMCFTDAPAAAAAPSGRAATATATADSDPTTAIVSTTARPTRQPAPPSITNARAPSLPLSTAARTHSQNGLSNSPQPTGTRDDPIPVDSDDENGNGNEQVVNRVGLSNGDTPVIEMLDSDSDEEQARGPPGGAVAAKAQGRKRTAGNTVRKSCHQGMHVPCAVSCGYVSCVSAHVCVRGDCTSMHSARLVCVGDSSCVHGCACVFFCAG